MINQITRMRLPDGSEVAFVDWGDLPLWSTAWLLTGFSDARVNFFTYLVGETVSGTSNCTNLPTATELDTNVATAAAMAGTEEMLIYSVKPEYQAFIAGGNDDDDVTLASPSENGMPQPNGPSLAILQAQTLLRLEVSDKIYIEAPLGYFNTGFGIFGSLVGTPAANALSSRVTAGLPSQEAVRSFAMPTYIGGTEKYSVYIAQFADALNFGRSDASSPAAITGYLMRVRILLEGLYKRPVS